MRVALVALVLATALGLSAAPASAEKAGGYVPAAGEDVVVYTHRFKAENFEAGLKLVKEGFTAAQAAAGQTRKNEILVDPVRHEVMLISFFGPGADVETWHKFMGRLDVLKQLEPMRSEPIQIERFKLETVTTAP